MYEDGQFQRRVCVLANVYSFAPALLMVRHQPSRPEPVILPHLKHLHLAPTATLKSADPFDILTR